MTNAKWTRRTGLALALGCCAAGYLGAQVPTGEPGNARPDRDKLPQPVYKVAQQLVDPSTGAASTPTSAPNEATRQPATTEHPLEPALKMAYSSLDTAAKIKDYTATMYKRERINGTLGDYECMEIKVRHQPFSAYTKFLAPANLQGQEAVYVAGKNDGKLIGHGVGIRRIAGWVPLDPNGALAMAGQRYPITEIGVYNLVRRLIEVGEADKKYGECEVKFFKGAKINGRLCTAIQVVHPVPRANFQYHLARIFVDDELNVPIRFEAYDWPTTQGGQPPLIEEYTYVGIKVNNNLTDLDFDINNPNYFK